MECSSCHDVHKLIGSAPSSGILAKLSGKDVNGRGSICAAPATSSNRVRSAIG